MDKKFMENYKIRYPIRKSKRKPRLSQIEIDGQIDEDTRKKLIKEIYELLWGRCHDYSITKKR